VLRLIGAIEMASRRRAHDARAHAALRVRPPRVGGRRGFVVQHATDTANATTYSPQALCSKTKYTLENLPSGSVVHFRVAAADARAASGMSPWSDWVAAMVG
jgi:hypothetical protein